MNAETLAVANVILTGVNLLALVNVAFWGGRWMGRVDTRIEYLERKEREE